MWFGGIGTYIKSIAGKPTPMSATRANDAIRINA
jgi:NAD-specific glutamate dehydrogenase